MPLDILSPSSFIFALALLWFLFFWIGGGVFFAILSLSRFMHVHRARFSCVFTLLSAVAAYGSAWLGVRRLLLQPVCIEQAKQLRDIFSVMFSCGAWEIFSAAGICFLLLMVLGAVVMFSSRGKR